MSNKNKIRIITDSNSGITQSEAKDLNITVIPMPFTLNGEEYLEDVNITQDRFYEMLADGADVKTSQPSQTYLEELWTDLLKDNDELVYIPMSSGLSGTCENAKRYAANFNGKVFVVDNLRISLSQKESVFEAIAMVKQGKSGKEIKEQLERTKGKASIYIVLGVMKYLKRGGRISPAAAALGDLLKLKPILFTRGDKFEKFAITMGLKQAERKIIDQFKKELETEFKYDYEAGKMVVSTAYTKDSEEAIKFKEMLLAQFPKLKFHYVDPLSLSVSCHIGPGAVAACLCVNNYLSTTEN